jgi:predicted MPP superfamily phosphohydrolase
MNIKLKIAQVSDVHLTTYRNLLEQVVFSLNQENLDLVVITGDLVDKPDENLYKLAVESINKIKHRVVVIPGDYDYSDEWVKYFGDRFKSTKVKDYCIDLMDTSYIGHKYMMGWGESLKEKDEEQYNWIMNSFKNDENYHLVFSHHPHSIVPKAAGDEFLADNLRAIYTGHTHQPNSFEFRYTAPKGDIPLGFCTTPLKFHGNACYNIILVYENDLISHMPRFVNKKTTAW